MKKILWVLCVLLLTLLLVGGCIWFFYSHITEPSVMPAKQLTARFEEGNELSVPMQDYLWNEPVLGGSMYKEFRMPKQQQMTPKISTKSNRFYVELKDTGNLQVLIQVKSADGILFEGDETQLRAFRFEKAGSYQVEVFAKQEPGKGRGYGKFWYPFTVEVTLDTTAHLSAKTAYQGDILQLVVEQAPEKPSAFSELGAVNFVERNGSYVAWIPVSLRQGTGERTVTVRCGDYYEILPVWIEASSYPKEHHKTAEGKEPPVITQTMINEYQNAIWPLHETAEPTQLWTEPFLSPVAMPITGQFGAYVYMDDEETPSRNSGIDIAAEKGMAVFAPNSGKVVYTGRLQLTGNTVVIEHGGGLKSYFYYMDSIAVQQGETVERNQQIGTVGDDGTNEEPHLNYELKIGTQSVNPVPVFYGKSALYY